MVLGEGKTAMRRKKGEAKRESGGEGGGGGGGKPGIEITLMTFYTQNAAKHKHHIFVCNIELIASYYLLLPILRQNYWKITK